MRKNPYTVAFSIAIILALGAFAYTHYLEKPRTLPRAIPAVGAPGTDHVHASMLIMIGDHDVDFCKPEFMLKSQYVHFENNDCTTIHRHATGVTLPTFFKTIGVTLTESCITLPTKEKYCNDGKNTLRVVINGGEVPIGELPYYEIRNNDHYLINYGPEEGAALRFKYNQVPPIPADINEPLNTDIPLQTP